MVLGTEADVEEHVTDELVQGQDQVELVVPGHNPERHNPENYNPEETQPRRDTTRKRRNPERI